MQRPTLILAVALATTLAAPGMLWAKKPEYTGGSADQNATPLLSFQSDVSTVTYGESVLLSWAAVNVRSCEASGDWAGKKPITGSERVSPQGSNARYVMTCRLKSQSATQTVNVAVEGAPPAEEPAPEPDVPAPTVSFQADPASVDYLGTTTLKWSATNADGCKASGGWLGSDLATSGSSQQGPLTDDTAFTLSCTGAGGTALKTISVAVSDAPDSGGAPPPAPADVPIGSIGDGNLETMIESYQYHYNLPAMAAVITRADQIAEWTAVGRRRTDSPEAVTLQDRWHLGSLTKAITGTVVGAIVERGKISWSTRPIDVWPEWKDKIRPAYHNVTLKQLTSHTSGLPNDVFAISSPASVKDSAPGTIMEKRRYWAGELLAQAPAVSAGTYYYSNAGFLVAGAMLEEVTGTPWEDLVRTYVYDPLGMATAGFGSPGYDNALGHKLVNGKLEPVLPGPGADNPAALGPAITAHASLADYAAFMVEHVRGSKGIDGIVDADTFTILHSPVSSTYAIGWVLAKLDSQKILGHSGTNMMWWCWVWVVPQYDVAIFIATNAANQEAENAVTELQLKLLKRATGLRW